MKILNNLFPFISENFISDPIFKKPIVINKDYRRIYHVVNFKKYFVFRNLETNISHSDLIIQFSKTQDEINKQIAKWASEDKHETLDVFFKSIETFKSKEEYEKIIQSIFYFANQMNPKRDRIVEFDDNITRKWISYESAMSFYSDSSAHKSFILHVFGEAQAPALFPSGFLARQLSNWDLKNEVYGKMPFTIEKALELNNKYLKDFIETSSLFTLQAFWLYNNCNHPNIRSIEDANSLMIKLAKIDLENFLNIIIFQPITRDKIYNFSGHVISIFGTYEIFEEFLVEVKNDEEYYNEFMTFYKLTKERGYNQVGFNFIQLKKSNIIKVEEKETIILNPQLLQDQLQKTQS